MRAASTWRPWSSCGRSTPARRSPGAWRAWGGWPWTWARGLEAFAALAVREDRPELAVRLTATAAALREVAGLPALSGARIERYLASARHLGENTISRLWAQGLAMSSDEAVALALEPSQ